MKNSRNREIQTSLSYLSFYIPFTGVYSNHYCFRLHKASRVFPYFSTLNHPDWPNHLEQRNRPVIIALRFDTCLLSKHQSVIATHTVNTIVIRIRIFFTCTRDSGKLIFSATSSLMKMSGYLVFWKRDSRMSSWARVKVVLSLRCFRGLDAEDIYMSRVINCRC